MEKTPIAKPIIIMSCFLGLMIGNVIGFIIVKDFIAVLVMLVFVLITFGRAIKLHRIGKETEKLNAEIEAMEQTYKDLRIKS